MPKVNFKKLDEQAVVPCRAHETDTGYDLTFIGVDHYEGDVIFFKTGIAVQLPRGYYLDIRARSSISKLPLMLATGTSTIDSGYLGEILVPIRVLHPDQGSLGITKKTYPGGIISIFGSAPPSADALANLILKKKPKLCQLVLQKRLDADFVEVQQLEETDRSTGGFGSTDLNTNS